MGTAGNIHEKQTYAYSQFSGSGFIGVCLGNKEVN
jgi:hypothetical protein